MKIKKVDPGHSAVLRDLISLQDICFPGCSDVSFHGDWWIAYDDGKAVGFAGLHPSHRTAAAGYMCLAGVAPEARGKGLQRRLIRVREREARKKGWSALLTDTRHENSHSINNLIECGFRAYRPSEPWNGPVWCYWRKIIDEGVA